MEIEKSIKEKFENIRVHTHNNMANALGLEFTRISRKEMRAVMPVSENTIQPMGILHGGASVAMAETLASVGAVINLTDDEKTAVGLEINANHIRPVSLGKKVVGISKPLHIGSQTQVWETRVETEEGKLVSISRCTLAIIRKR